MRKISQMKPKVQINVNNIHKLINSSQFSENALAFIKLCTINLAKLNNGFRFFLLSLKYFFINFNFLALSGNKSFIAEGFASS